MKLSDLYREFARVTDMCDGTTVSPLKCVKLHNHNLLIDRYIPYFDEDPNEYSFALGIVEDKPVFSGDILYDISGYKHTVCEDFTLAISLDVLSWHPPTKIDEEALNEAGWLFTSIGANVHFNDIKPVLRKAILKYLELAKS